MENNQSKKTTEVDPNYFNSRFYQLFDMFIPYYGLDEERIFTEAGKVEGLKGVYTNGLKLFLNSLKKLNSTSEYSGFLKELSDREPNLREDFIKVNSVLLALSENEFLKKVSRIFNNGFKNGTIIDYIGLCQMELDKTYSFLYEGDLGMESKRCTFSFIKHDIDDENLEEIINLEELADPAEEDFVGTSVGKKVPDPEYLRLVEKALDATPGLREINTKIKKMQGGREK